jgi:hypothetical protein
MRAVGEHQPGEDHGREHGVGQRELRVEHDRRHRRGDEGRAERRADGQREDPSRIEIQQGEDQCVEHRVDDEHAAVHREGVLREPVHRGDEHRIAHAPERLVVGGLTAGATGQHATGHQVAVLVGMGGGHVEVA